MKEQLKVNKSVTVFGAYGHTGKFVVRELVKRGYRPILSGRDKGKLIAIGKLYPDLEIRPASTSDAKSLDNALAGASTVINCAGPFLDTATPIIKAALRKGVHYLDMAAEQASVLETYKRFSLAAFTARIVILPAMAFYGGLADLLATAAMGDWTTADGIEIGLALDSWLPTAGTRLTGERNTSPRLTYAKHQLMPVSEPQPTRQWQFPEPFGLQDMAGFSLIEIITISKHLRIKEINTFMNLAPIKDIHNSKTPPPQAADATGRSDQIFLMEVIVRSGDNIHKVQASGRDIYAITAPLIVEAAARIAEGRFKKWGIVAAGEAFDADDFLKSLSPDYLSVSLEN